MNASARVIGFTLIEVVITVAIIGLLAAMAVPLVELSVQRSNEHELRLALRTIRRGIDAHKQAYDEGRIVREVGASGYPRTLSSLADGVPDAASPETRKVYFLRRIPRDPMARDPNQRPDETWGLRSYDSEPDAPSAGKDVFDVYSQSPATGINGLAYRQW